MALLLFRTKLLTRGRKHLLGVPARLMVCQLGTVVQSVKQATTEFGGAQW